MWNFLEITVVTAQRKFDENIVRIGVFLSVLLSLAACGTFIGRSETSPVEGDYYKGMKGGAAFVGSSPNRVVKPMAQL